MTVVIPEPLLAKLHPRRAVPGSCPRSRKNQVAALRKKLGGKFTYKSSIAKGVESAVSPELAPIRRSAHALVTALTKEALQDASTDVLGAFHLMARRHDFRLPVTAAMVEARGLADAVEVELCAGRWMMDAASGGWMNEVYLVRRTTDDGRWGSWLALREAVCAAEEQDYENARERARRLHDDASVFERAHLAFAFPDEPWADDAMRACLADPALDAQQYGFLLSACRDAALVRAHLDRAPTQLPRYALDVALSLASDDAVPLLAALLPTLLQRPRHGPLLKTPPRQVATALACFRTPAAAEALAPYVGHAILGPIAAQYFQSAPELAAVLQSHAKTKAGRDVAARIAAQAEIAHADADAQSSDGSAARITQAAADDLPPVLRDRPWRPRAAKNRGPAPRVLEGIALPADIDERLVLPPGTRSAEDDLSRPIRDMTEAEVADAQKEHDAGRPVVADFTYGRTTAPNTWEYVRVPAELGLAWWNDGTAYTTGGPLSLVAAHGLRALPGFLAGDKIPNFDYEGADAYVAAIRCFESPRIAPFFARLAARRKKQRRMAQTWLHEHADIAAVGLVPSAVGPLTADRADAEAALLYLATHDHRDAVCAAADRFGDDARAVIDALLSRDPLAVDQKPPKAPSFLRIESLPTVPLADGGAHLGADAHDALLEMLRIGSLDAPYAGVALVREACDRTSLAAFAAALLEQWLLAGAPGRHEWMLFANVWFDSEAATRRIAQLARDWARRDKAKAARAVTALAAIGSDLALLHLGHIAETSRFTDLRGEVRAMLATAAAARGLTPDELEDRTVPDLGLASDGTLTVSLGARSWVATLDPSLSMVVRDEDGALVRALRASKQDDPTAAKAALDRLKALRTDAAAIADRQIRRFERAMTTARELSVRDFQQHILSHPVSRHLARGVIFEAVGGAPLDGGARAGARTFRVTEDGSLADAEDDALVLDDNAERIRVAHPLRLSDGERARWSAVLSDYEIIQPFEQLGRATFACDATNRAASESDRVKGCVVAANRVLGYLEARGYRRNDTGMVTAYLRDLAPSEGVDDVVVAAIALSPGIDIAYLRDAEPQTLGTLTLRRGAHPVAFRALDPVACSELLRDLDGLTALE